MAFHQNLRIARLEKGLTQPVLAERAQIEQSYLSKLENGRSMPSDEVLGRLAEALATTPEELMRNGEVPQAAWRRWLWPGIAMAALVVGVLGGVFLREAREMEHQVALQGSRLSVAEQLHALAPAGVKLDSVQVGQGDREVQIVGRSLDRAAVLQFLAAARNAGLGEADHVEFREDDTWFRVWISKRDVPPVDARGEEEGEGG